MNLNKVLLGGRLTRDPEIRHLPNGTAVCSFGLAINRTWKDASGERQERTTFLEIEAWGKLGEYVGERGRKGGAALVEGSLDFQEWTDKQSGGKRSKVIVNASSVQLVNIAPREQSVATGGDRTAAPAAAPRPASPSRADEDIPFAREVGP